MSKPPARAVTGKRATPSDDDSPQNLKSEVFVMKRKVYWSVERSVWGAIKPVHYYFREKENAEMFAHENEYCGCPEKHTASLNVYEQIIFED